MEDTLLYLRKNHNGMTAEELLRYAKISGDPLLEHFVEIYEGDEVTGFERQKYDDRIDDLEEKAAGWIYEADSYKKDAEELQEEVDALKSTIEEEWRPEVYELEQHLDALEARNAALLKALENLGVEI